MARHEHRFHLPADVKDCDSELQRVAARRFGTIACVR